MMNSIEQTIREKEEEKRKQQEELLAKSKYHLVDISKRRYGVITSNSFAYSNGDNPPYRTFRFVPGLEKVTYDIAYLAVCNLNAGRTTPGMYDKE